MLDQDRRKDIGSGADPTSVESLSPVGLGQASRSFELGDLFFGHLAP